MTDKESANNIRERYDEFTVFMLEQSHKLNDIELQAFIALVEGYAITALNKVPIDNRIRARKLASDYHSTEDEE